MYIQQVCIWWPQHLGKMSSPLQSQLYDARENQVESPASLKCHCEHHITPEYFHKAFGIYIMTMYLGGGGVGSYQHVCGTILAS